jgi:hypothetical protein
MQGAHINESCHTNDLSDKSYLYESYLCDLPETCGKRSKDLVGGGTRKRMDVLAAVPTGRPVALGEP